MDNNQACCAHCKVVLKHKDYHDGTRSDYWECSDGCGCKFWPESFSTSLQSKLTATEKELEEAKELNAFVTKGSFEASQVMAKENSHVRFENEELKKIISELTSALDRVVRGYEEDISQWEKYPDTREAIIGGMVASRSIAKEALSHATACLKERKEPGS